MPGARGEGAGLLAGEEGEPEVLLAEGPPLRPASRHPRACRIVTVAVPAVAVCAVVAALRWGSLGGPVRRSGAVDVTAGMLLRDWGDNVPRPKIAWFAEEDFNPKDLFDSLATNKDLTEPPPETSAPTSAPTPAPTAPTPAPTSAPPASTSAPTAAPRPVDLSDPPTPEPTRAPTPAPTAAATPAPTAAATPAPTAAATPAPTAAATPAPTAAATPAPTPAATPPPAPPPAADPALAPAPAANSSTPAATPVPTALTQAPTSGPTAATIEDLMAKAVAERIDEADPSDLLEEPLEVNGSLPDTLWPRENKTLLLIGQDIANIEGYEDAFGTPPGFSVYIKIEDVAHGLWGTGDWGAGKLCAACLLQDHGMGVAFNLAVDMVDTIDDVVAGVWDDNIKNLASWVKTTGGPVYLRPGYEFDGPWNHFDPETYKLAYVRIVDLFREAEVKNVLWVWHSAVFRPNYKGYSQMEWYPGDDYVDLFGASVFTAVYEEGHPNKGHARQEMADLQDWAKLATARGKPLVIVESTARGYKMSDAKAYGAWKSWFQPVFTFIEQNDVRVFAYINCNWDVQPMWSGDTWGDTRLQSNQVLTDLWITEMDKARWKDVFDDPIVPDPRTDQGRYSPHLPG